LRSDDGGETFEPIQEVGDPIGEVLLSPNRKGAMVVRAFSSSAAYVHSSSDGGASWSTNLTPATVRSAAALSPGTYAMGTPNGVFLVQGGAPAVGLTSPAIPPIFDLSASQPSSPILFGRTDRTLERLRANDGGEFQPAERDTAVPSIPLLDLPPIPRPSLKGPDEVTLREGQDTTKRYLLELTGTPTPVDVYFLFDTSGSMGSAIRGVREAMRQVVLSLVRHRVDAHFGIGRYVSYADPPAYERVRDIGPPDQQLAKALASLTAEGGGYESQLAALYQSATGDGDDESHRQGYAYIPPNRQANFRKGTLRTIIHMTDEPFSEGTPNPTYETTIGALVESNIQQLGIALQNEPVDVGGRTPRYGLDRVARGSGAAAEEPLDCDGDGIDDIGKGAPLVCVLPPVRAQDSVVMAEALVGLIRAVEHARPITVTADGHRAEVLAAPEGLLDLRKPATLPIEVRFRCPEVERDERESVRLAASLEGRQLAVLPVALRCRDVPEEETASPVRDHLARAVFAGKGLTGPLPPAPPAPVPGVEAQGASQNQVQTQAQAQGVAQGAAAPQEEERPQLAFAHAHASTEEQWQMSQLRTRREPELPSAWLALVAGVLGAFTTAACRSSQVRTRRSYR